MKDVDAWVAHWDAKRGIEDPVALNGYCIGGAPLTRERYEEAVVTPYMERLELEPHHAVLDVGCGAGLTLTRMEQIVSKCVGVDPSRTMVERYSGSAETLVCDADSLPFEGEQFDRILMASVALYFPDDDYFRRVVAKCLSILRRPGVFLIGDMLVGPQRPDSEYRHYDPVWLIEFLESLDMPYSIAAQAAVKRGINRRRDVILYKD